MNTKLFQVHLVELFICFIYIVIGCTCLLCSSYLLVGDDWKNVENMGKSAVSRSGYSWIGQISHRQLLLDWGLKGELIASPKILDTVNIDFSEVICNNNKYCSIDRLIRGDIKILSL